MNDDVLLTLPEALDYLGTSKASFYRRGAADLPFYRRPFKRSRMWRKADLDGLLAQENAEAFGDLSTSKPSQRG